MHEEAEKGIAAHWAYKEDGARVTASVQKRIQNLRELLATLREVGDSASDSEILKPNFWLNEFTPSRRAATW